MTHREALEQVRRKLFADYCLSINTSQPSDTQMRKFTSLPVVRIIDDALTIPELRNIPSLKRAIKIIVRPMLDGLSKSKNPKVSFEEWCEVMDQILGGEDDY